MTVDDQYLINKKRVFRDFAYLGCTEKERLNLTAMNRKQRREWIKKNTKRLSKG